MSPRIQSAAELDRLSFDSADVRRAVTGGRLHRVHRGWYVAHDEWVAATPEERHRLEVRAVARNHRDADVCFTQTSAAVLHGLPVFRWHMSHVHVAGSGGDGSAHPASGLVARHRVSVPRAHRAMPLGLPATSLIRTVVDVARLTSMECAISAADAAVRSVAWDRGARTYDTELAEAWRASAIPVLAALTGARGIRRARDVLAFADGRGDRPAESTTRWYLHLLGFAPPRLQVAVPGPHGRDYAVDLGLDDADVWIEVDGEAKYTDARFTGGRSITEIVRQEKEREDWIRGTTGRRVIRIASTDIRSVDMLAARLRAFGVRRR